MFIKEVTDNAIVFDNGSEITFDHDKDCCEYNFADFSQLEPLALSYDFEEVLRFEAVDKQGFRFGDSKMMFFVPCYSEQNGYYSSDIEIWYNGCVDLNRAARVLFFDAELTY